MKRVLIEGWRGLSQSLAMVNHYQLLELVKSPSLLLYCSDLPYILSRWSTGENAPGFSAEHWTSITSIPASTDEAYDTVYRVAYPYERSKARAKRIVTFMVTEFGLASDNFATGNCNVDTFCTGDNSIVTPSRWSRMKLLEYGYPEEKVHLIPHGVNTDVFFPLTGNERQAARNDLELDSGQFVFLNVGALSDNKGVDRLLLAFQRVRQSYANAHLVLKDSSGLYGRNVADFIDLHMKQYGPFLQETLESISVVPSNLSLAELRLLYGCADCYVAPYRAEGFNLPVIESIACGTPVIVTAGGATDDYCDSRTSLKIVADKVENADTRSHHSGYWLEPRIDSLTELMERALTGNGVVAEQFVQGRKSLIDSFSWSAAVRKLEMLF